MGEPAAGDAKSSRAAGSDSWTPFSRECVSAGEGASGYIALLGRRTFAEEGPASSRSRGAWRAEPTSHAASTCAGGGEDVVRTLLVARGCGGVLASLNVMESSDPPGTARRIRRFPRRAVRGLEPHRSRRSGAAIMTVARVLRQRPFSPRPPSALRDTQRGGDIPLQARAWTEARRET